ncbi:MAG: hypothetical protein AUI14_13350 [Actinobacteria bacterium 13_2_20CM_2_71_6]|nr:MAG: hypothetical protein AUI14_13350 [Actinobacteria bacterium 13_2_20CM_2_71_6]
MARAPLPPLPPLPAAIEAEARPGGRSVLDVLGAEHRALASLCGRVAGSRSPGRAAGPAGRPAPVIVSALGAMLSGHLSAEEQSLYPTVRAVLPDGAELADAEIAADAAIQYALREVASGADPSIVEPLLRKHIRRCEDELLPRLSAALDETELVRLGNRVVIAEEAAPTRPHPGTPFRPPWNKLVEPVVGVLDKVRDVATGRATRIEDVVER